MQHKLFMDNSVSIFTKFNYKRNKEKKKKPSTLTTKKQ